jgi:hypothetical protein
MRGQAVSLASRITLQRVYFASKTSQFDRKTFRVWGVPQIIEKILELLSFYFTSNQRRPFIHPVCDKKRQRA